MGTHNLAIVFAPNILREGAVYKTENDCEPGQPGVVNVFNPLQALEDSKRDIAIMETFIDLATAIADRLGAPKLRIDGGRAVDLEDKSTAAEHAASTNMTSKEDKFEAPEDDQGIGLTNEISKAE